MLAVLTSPALGEAVWLGTAGLPQGSAGRYGREGHQGTVLALSQCAYHCAVSRASVSVVLCPLLSLGVCRRVVARGGQY